MKTLRFGDRGQEVKELQKILKLQVDGIFGQITLEAVKKFQMDNHLKVDGVVGENTWRVLNQVSPQNKRKINKNILHCSATPEGKDYSVDTIRQWHKNQGWSDIGYHWVIYRDGSIHQGRKEDLVGSHCSGQNTNSIGVVYVGGMDKDNKKPKDSRTKEQKHSLFQLIHSLLVKYNLKIDNVYCHNNFSNKACPSFNIEDFKKEYYNYLQFN